MKNFREGSIDRKKKRLKMERYIDMILNKKFIELPICPSCGNITHMGSKFLPCCGKENHIDLSRIKWLRLVPIDIVEEGLESD